MTTAPREDTERHQVTRIRRETRRRGVTVTAVDRLSPNMVRIGFAGDDLRDFESTGADDHVKLFIPDAASNGSEARRDYTPRRFDTAAGTLVIDFALHEAGPATRWAAGAKVGDTITIGGPRGSAVISDDFDWYWLIGDETALPSIARRCEELRPGVPVTAVIAIENDADAVGLPDRAGLDVIWSPRAGDARGDAARLAAALPPLPAGEGYIWIAAEAQVAHALRAHVIDTLGQPKAWTKAAGYWTLSEADTHMTIKD